MAENTMASVTEVTLAIVFVMFGPAWYCVKRC
jgi:hypothetical protein